MPKGRFRSLAKTAVCSALPALVIPRKILISPAILSARNTSPLGALRISRGSCRPDAYTSTLKPGGTCGHAFAGRGTIFGTLPDEGVASGRGRSFAVIFRVLPGLSYRKSVNGGGGVGRFRFAATCGASTLFFSPSPGDAASDLT